MGSGQCSKAEVQQRKYKGAEVHKARKYSGKEVKKVPPGVQKTHAGRDFIFAYFLFAHSTHTGFAYLSCGFASGKPSLG